MKETLDEQSRFGLMRYRMERADETMEEVGGDAEMLNMRTSATWQHQHTRITCLHRFDVVVEPPFCLGMMEHVTIL